MNNVVEAGGLQDATTSEYGNKAIFLDVTYMDPRAGVQMRAGGADETD